jgi:hypothetical protein
MKNRLFESLYMHNTCSPQPHPTHPVLPHRGVVLPRNRKSRYTGMAHMTYVDWLCGPSAVVYHTTRLPTTLLHYAHASRHHSTLTLGTCNTRTQHPADRNPRARTLEATSPRRKRCDDSHLRDRVAFAYALCIVGCEGRIDTRSPSR